MKARLTTTAPVRVREDPHRKASKVDIIGAVLLAIHVNSIFLAGTPIVNWMPITLSALLNVVVPLYAILMIAHHQLSARIQQRNWRAKHRSRGRFLRPTSRAVLVATLAFLMLSLLLVLAAGGTIPGEYANRKLFLLVAVTVPLGLSVFVLLRNSEQQRAFFASLAALSVVGLLLLSNNPAPESQSTGFAIIDGANSIGSARLIGAGVVLAATYLLISRTLRTRTVLLVILLLAGLGGMIATGSRGPFMSVLFAIAAIILTMVVRGHMRARTPIMLGLLAVGVGIVLDRASEDGWARILGYLEGERDGSTAAREWLWQVGSDTIVNTPNGIGLGNFHFLSGYTYPHNVFIEVLVEAGWVAGALFVLIVGAALVQGFRNSKDILGYSRLSLLVFALVSAMVSGDINDNRLLWVAIIVALFSTMDPTGEIEKSADSSVRRPPVLWVR